ncbi:MAG TPA: peptide ABC transporter substrate-binding protein, partial [Candidatus Acidoferrales bacterium]|nr:peptide ABC transporter substrate-binding protein [Candidatus Acidoferrales bacterium]
SVADVSKSDYIFKPLGTGPFKITEFKAADHITAERNPLYRVKGKPLLDRLIFRSVPSREAAVAQLKAGEVDAMWNLLEAQLPDLEKNTDIKVLTTPSPSVERLEFNLSKPGNPADPRVPHPVLGDVKLREALELATPKKRLIDRLLFGKATPAQTTLSIGIYSPKDVKQEDYNPQKANQILDQAGWTKGADGIRSKGGVRAHLSITTTTGDRIREQVEQVLIDEWHQIGVELEIKNVPSSVLFGSWSQNAPRKRGNFDINMYASTPDPDPQATIAGRFHSKNIPRPENNGAGFNYYRYSNPEVDRLIDQAGATIDVEKRKQLYSQILRDLEDDHIGVWLYNRGSIDAFRTNVGGYKPDGWDNITWTTQDWYVKR